MSNPAPPKLLELAAHSLLSNEASPIPALEEFTVNYFPPLLMAAFTLDLSQKTEKRSHGCFCQKVVALKALVQVWPFPFLHLGSLIVQWPNQDSLQAALACPAQRTCPR